ncbi:hypothetical protein CO006_00415, partial [Candidatus Roizmanbacteria bacterium CG_4_8_14_3_um_filter_35_14]
NPPNNPAAGTEDYCQTETVSKTVLNTGESLDITATAKNADIKTFTWKFYNLDNLDASNNPKSIKFDTTNFEKTVSLGVTASSQTLTLNFSEIDKADKNWNYYAPKPKNIRIDAYFANAAGKISKYDANCSKSFKSAAIDATPTPNPKCDCKTNGSCHNKCFFDWFPDVTPSTPKCNLDNSIFQSNPTADNKKAWCRYYKKVRGDADGDGQATFLDYFYYVSARAGAKIPPTVNPDFNGDGTVDSSSDRAVIIRSLQ